MNNFINELSDFIKKSDLDTRSAVQAYFDQVIWSIEKDEWMRMTNEDQQQFVNTVEQYVKK